jgi:Ser/Thr protein kinase RdoA (MazF antagonist)
MQPNNILYYKNNYAVIDFDNCGIGLYGDDLAFSLFAFEHVTEGREQKIYQELKEALFTRYSEHMPLGEEDINLVPYFLLARKLASIAWLELKRSKSKLRAYFPTAVARAIKFFEQLQKNNYV